MKNFVRVKICGITRHEDAQAAAAAGADALGFVFFSGSRRYIAPQAAREIIAALPPFVCAVGLFVNQTAEEIGQILRHVPLDMVQFHGGETPEFCRSFSRAYIKAVRVAAAEDVQAACAAFADARALLFDAAVAGQYGGTGQTFDWTLLPANIARPWILAGGLTAENVAAAVAAGAAAVDVSGGVEAASGIKDAQKIRAFIRNARG